MDSLASLGVGLGIAMVMLVPRKNERAVAETLLNEAQTKLPSGFLVNH